MAWQPVNKYRRRFMTLRERFDDFIVVAPNGCWIWAGAMDGSGYGMFQVGGRSRRAHIVAYELFVGPMPAGKEIDHLCRVRACANWRHLEPVTRAENIRRSPLCVQTIHSQQTHCKRGHPFADDNLLHRRNGSRACRACRKRDNMIQRAKERGEVYVD